MGRATNSRLRHSHLFDIRETTHRIGWVQGGMTVAEKSQSSVVMDTNIESAKQILMATSPRRMFSKVVESIRTHVKGYPKSKKVRYKKYAQGLFTVCVVCIENMALTICDHANRFDNTKDTKTY
jgi:hypothetical protein